MDTISKYFCFNWLADVTIVLLRETHGWRQSPVDVSSLGQNNGIVRINNGHLVLAAHMWCAGGMGVPLYPNGC